MGTTINLSSTSEALNEILNHIHLNIFKNIFEAYIKINAPFDDQLNDTCLYKLLIVEKPLIILFEYNTTDTKIFWRLSGEKFYFLEIHEDKDGLASLFCAELIADELRKGNIGILNGYERYLNVQMRNIGNKEGHNLIIAAINQKKLDVIKILVKCGFDIDYQDNRHWGAIEHACDKYMNDKAETTDFTVSGEIILALLKANSRYPVIRNDTIRLTYDDLPPNVKDFTEQNEKLHDNLGKREFDSMKDVFKEKPDLIHFYNRENKSLMSQAITTGYDREAYELLVTYGISTGSHEDLDDVFHQFKDKQPLASAADDVRRTNENYSSELPETHIFSIISKIRIINNLRERNHNWTKFIMDALGILDKESKCSKILRVVALCKNLKIFLDFKNHTVNFFDPRFPNNAEGVIQIIPIGESTVTEIITIGAKHLLDDLHKKKVIGVLIHEFCHLAILKTFMNNYNPYSVNDEVKKKEFEAVVKECKKNQTSERISNVFSLYPESQHHLELIVTVVHAIMDYYDQSLQNQLMDVDGESSIAFNNSIENAYQPLFNYFDNTVLPELKKVLKPLKTLEDKFAIIEFKDLTEPMKAKLLHQQIDFQGAITTLYEVIGNDEDICQHLTSNNIRYLLNRGTVFFDAIKVTKPHEIIERRFLKILNNLPEPSNTNNPIPLGTISNDLKHGGVILLADSPFSGKTSAFIDIGQKLKTINKTYLVPLIYLDKIQHILSKHQELESSNGDLKIFQILLNILNPKCPFETEIFKKLLKENRIILLFDGLDKLCPEVRKFFLKIVNTLKTITYQNERGDISTIQQWVSTRLITSIRNDHLFQNTFNNIFKFAPYTDDERAGYVHNTIKGDNREKLEGMVLHFWFLCTIKCDQNNSQQDSLINSFMELNKEWKVNQSSESLNFYETILNLYIQQKNKCKKSNEAESLDPVEIPFERVMHVNALYSKFGEDSKQFAELRNWDRKGRTIWTQCKIEPFGFLNFNENSETNYWKFLSEAYIEFFVSHFLLNILYAEWETISPKQANTVVNILIKMCKSIESHDIIHKVILGYIKTKSILSLNDKVKNEITQKISILRSSIIESNHPIEALKFWSVILSIDLNILLLLWQPDDTNGLLRSIISNMSTCPVNLVKIFEVGSFSFGTKLHQILDQRNIDLNGNQPSVNGTCEGFAKNFENFLNIFGNNINSNEISDFFNNYRPNDTFVTDLKTKISDVCIQKCQDISKILTSRTNTALISLSISDAIEKFYSKNSRNIDIIDFNGSQGELIGKILENLNNSMTMTVYGRQSSIKLIENQTILLFDDFQSFNNFNKADPINIKFINPIRLLVYCVNTSEMEISSLKTDLVTPPYYYFLIVGADTKISLWTFENRKDITICHENQTLIKINEFSSTNMTWTNEKIFPKKYKNFHGCMMNLGVNDFASFDRTIHDYSSDEFISTFGLTNSLLFIMADQLNFVLHSYRCFDSECLDQKNVNRYLYNIIMTMSIDAYAINFDSNYKWSLAMLNIQCTPRLLIPPGDLYTSIEKMLLPFDTETWIGLLLIFISGIVAISVINRFPQNIKDVIFGTKIGIPSLNFFLAFFGEAQKRSPDGTFARLIWIFFIFYCLVIRTCYQGKLFEFTTTAIRKPEHRTLDELRDENYTLYILDEMYSNRTMAFIESVMGLHIEYVSEAEYTNIYLENITDPSFTGTLFSSDLVDELNAYYINTRLTRRFISTPFSKSYYGIGFMYQNLWNERFHDIISGLITGGLVNYHLEEMTKSKWNMMPTYFETDNIVLNLNHLGFGFQICFISAYLAFVTFLIEIGYFWVRNYFKNCSYSQKRKEKHKIIMVQSVKSNLNENLQEKPPIKSDPSTNAEKWAVKSSMSKCLDDEYSSDDSNSSKESMLRTAFGKRVKVT